MLFQRIASRVVRPAGAVVQAQPVLLHVVEVWITIVRHFPRVQGRMSNCLYKGTLRPFRHCAPSWCTAPLRVQSQRLPYPLQMACFDSLRSDRPFVSMVRSAEA